MNSGSAPQPEAAAMNGSPRIVFNMANDDYHALPAIGCSGIKKLARSPRHYYASALDPLRPVSKPTPAMSAGTLAHCALLEPGRLVERYTVRPAGIDGRTKEGKAWILDHTHAGCEFVTEEQMQTAMRQADAVRALPEVAALLETGIAEVSAFWTDETTGEQCKCRPDLVSPAGKGVILLDLKTCQDASPTGFPRSIANFGYHLQDAWYCDGYEKAAEVEVLGLVFACVEADWPHAAAAYMLDDDSRTKARADNRRLLDLYATCKRSGDWPGYAASIQPISLPAWA